MTRYSVIVPAWNAGADLAACLKSIIDSMPPGGEVIAADDGSTDDTVAIATSCGVKVLTGRQQQGAAAARNRGVEAAQGAILVFLDADVEVHPETIARLVGSLEAERDLAALFGSDDDRPRARGLLTEFRNLLHHFTHQRGRQEAGTFWTGCGAMRREWFERVGGFDVQVRGIEDVELGIRVREQGGRIRLDGSIQVCHRKRWTLASMVRTDVKMRALPWMEFVASRKGLANDLYTQWRDRACAGLVVAGVALAWRWEGWLMLGIATILRGDWHLFLARKRGVWFAVRAIPLHWLYLLYSALSVLWWHASRRWR